MQTSSNSESLRHDNAFSAGLVTRVEAADKDRFLILLLRETGFGITAR
jgi:hypothetical protein